MKFVLKLIKYIITRTLILVSILLVLVATVVGAIVIRPTLLINEPVLKFASRFSLLAGVEVHWKKLDIQINSQKTILQKKVILHTQGLCVALPGQDISGCGEDLQLEFAASFSKLVPKLTEVGPLELHKLDWQVGRGADKIQGVFNVEGEDEHRTELQSKGQWAVQAWGNANLPDRSKADVRAYINLNQAIQDGISFEYNLNGHYIKRRKKISVQAEGLANPQQIKTRLTGFVDGWIPGLTKVSVNECDLDLVKRDSKDTPGLFKMHCPVVMSTPPLPSALPQLQMKLPAAADMLIEADATTSQFPPSGDSRVDGKIQIGITPVSAALFDLNGKVNATLDGVLADFPNQWKVKTNMALNLKIRPFEELVHRMRNTDWAVPAPFQVLKGSVETHVLGEATMDETTVGKFPIQLKTQLASQTERLNIDGTGTFSFDMKQNQDTGKTAIVPKLDFKANLADVQLQLPRLNWAAPPRLFPDGRILTRHQQQLAEKSKSNDGFKYNIAFVTPPGHPVKIMSNLAQAAIPVDVDLKLGDSTPIEGTVGIENFPIEIFRRKAIVNHLRVGLKSPSKYSTIDGALVVDYADYTITVRIESLIDKPVVQLSSDPPLPQNQLVAALLFGRPLDELDTDQTASVGNTRAAIADGAIGIASLYALASTPVQSVGYDPSTGIVSAKVRIAEGTSLNVGTGANATSMVYSGTQSTTTPVVGVRKRLGGPWTIETDVTSSGTSTGIAAAYLEWSKRY